MNKKKRAALASCITGFPEELILSYINQIESDLPVPYFEELQLEYEYLTKQSSLSDGNFIIAADYDEAIHALQQRDKIVGILSIEGLHSFISLKRYGLLFSQENIFNDPNHDLYKELYQQYEKNISKVKCWGREGNHTPFFVTFTHHFWNFLCGHAASVKSFALNQQAGMGGGFTALGREVLHMLLSKKNGRRILIDIKHMSVLARRNFYELLDEYYFNASDMVPIIASHTCVSGITAENALNNSSNSATENNGYFDHWPINLTNEDILAIFKSKGLIGLNFNRERMPGKLVLRQLRAVGNAQDFRTIYIMLLIANMLYIVNLCGTAEAWKLICLGTDFDGLISPMEAYPDAWALGSLRQDLVDFFDHPADIPHTVFTTAKIKALTKDYPAAVLADMICSKNVADFLKHYFNDGYRMGMIC